MQSSSLYIERNSGLHALHPLTKLALSGLCLVLAFALPDIRWLLAAFGLILSAAYMLPLYRRVVLGEMTNPKLATITDMSSREIAIIVPLAAGTVILGVYPSLVSDLFTDASARLLEGIARTAPAIADAAAAIGTTH